MRISFDLDDTLIAKKRFPLEKEPFAAKLFGAERLRLGTITLFKALRNKGHQIGVYTTSYRSKAKIKRMFWAYGLSVDYVVNQQLHENTLGKRSKSISKYPPAFEIDLHIDDSLGVECEGEVYGFNTVIVAMDDLQWIDKILERVDGTTI